MSDPLPFWKYQFASDNTAPMCPEAEAALVACNRGWSPSYGDDPWSERARRAVADFFATDCRTYFVFSGSAANGLALSHYCRPYHSVLCHPFAHVQIDEACGPEFHIGGGKLTLVDGPDGKIDPAGIPPVFARGHGLHSPKPRVLSLTETTEAGTVYRPEEIRVLAAVAREHGLLVHMDGARFCNALAATGAAPAELTWLAGVDVLSLGATKNGGPFCEAVVFFGEESAEEFEWRRKMAGQLASKQRFLTAPFAAMLAESVWRRNAEHANACARRLAEGLAALPGVGLRFPVEANAVFATLPRPLALALLDRGWHFYEFADVGAWRFMCSWNSDTAALEALLADAQAATGTLPQVREG